MSQLCGMLKILSDSKIADLLAKLVIVPAFTGRGLAHLYDAWRLWR
jgi:hypothetical protein